MKLKVREEKISSYESSEDKNNLGKNESTSTVGDQNLETNLNSKTDLYQFRDSNIPNSNKMDDTGISNYNHGISHNSGLDVPEKYSRPLEPIEHSHETISQFRCFDSNANITDAISYQTSTLTSESNISHEEKNSPSSRY